MEGCLWSIERNFRNIKTNLQWMKASGVLKEMSTSVVACPVDVEIYDVSGNLIHTMKDGVEESGTIGKYLL